MHAKQLYEYTVIRIVPRVEREEFINAGIVMFCKKTSYLNAKYFINQEKLKCLYSESDVQQIEENLKAFVAIAKGEKNAGPIAQLDAPSRFRWLTATRSTIIQAGKVHPGFCENEDAALSKLFDRLVI